MSGPKAFRAMALALLMAGCARAPEPIDLAANVGKSVHLVGVLSGPGKLALYYLPASGDTVYLTDFDNPASIPMGAKVTVDGKLQHYSQPFSDRCDTEEEADVDPFCTSGEEPSHYYIEEATVVRVVRQSG